MYDWFHFVCTLDENLLSRLFLKKQIEDFELPRSDIYLSEKGSPYIFENIFLRGCSK